MYTSSIDSLACWEKWYCVILHLCTTIFAVFAVDELRVKS